MKKLLAIVLALVMIFALVACGGGETPTPTAPEPAAPEPAAPAPEPEAPPAGQDAPQPSAPDEEGFELVLITDLGTIDDRGFNQSSWEGLVKYATEFGISHTYIKPADQGDDAYLNAIDLAVQSGAKVIVTPGFLFETPIFEAQDRYPNVKFVLLDGSPNNGDWDNFVGKVADNTVAVFYAEEQSGFLAGYAAVYDGYRSLGFMGGMAVPAVVRFGHGFIQGADLAAQELGLKDGEVTLNYYYTGTFAPAPEIQTMAAAWYNDGVECIFVCGGGIVFSVITAAEQAGTVIIGVDTDQSSLSDVIITSAMKLLAQSVYDKLADFYAGTFPGGQEILYSAANNGVGLPMDSSKFENFTQADYDALYEKLVNGTIKVDDNFDQDSLMSMTSGKIAITSLN